jgi:FkbM family methyltransferase
MDLRFIYRGFKARYRDQRLEIKNLLKNLKQDSIAIDVGSNKGSYLWSLSKEVPLGRVIAFEPQPILAKYLVNACIKTNLKNVLVENYGVSSKSGVFSLAIPGKNLTSPGASFEKAVFERENCKFIKIKTITLDNYFKSEKKHIGALKIDVEGHEMSVLIGAKKIINLHKPIILCESEQRHLTKGKVKDVLNFIEALGYDGYLIAKDSLIPVKDFLPDIHQKQVGERYWDNPDYFNNFIFKPKVLSND